MAYKPWVFIHNKTWLLCYFQIHTATLPLSSLLKKTFPFSVSQQGSALWLLDGDAPAADLAKGSPAVFFLPHPLQEVTSCPSCSWKEAGRYVWLSLLWGSSTIPSYFCWEQFCNSGPGSSLPLRAPHTLPLPCYAFFCREALEWS